MKILLLNQAFYPDVVSSGQHAADLALELTAAGHDVTVVASRNAYDDPGRRFAAREEWNGIQIVRVSMSRFGKATRWRRAMDFGTFFVSSFLRVLLLPHFDLVIAMTSPPLISALGAFLARLNSARFVFWVMDLNPDEAIAAQWLKPGSAPARALSAILKYSLKRANRIVALDRFMALRLAAKGVDQRKISVIPPWSHDECVSYTVAGREDFRREHGLAGKFVVMYSGNHSPCHPLDTVLQAAEQLAGRDDIAFCFVGGGSGFRKVRDFATANGLANLHCIPYQPLDRLAASLSAADLHLVVMGEPFVGIVHPCKVYNVRRLGIPFLYVGPEPSHVSDLSAAASFRHGDVSGIRDFIAAAHPSQVSPPPDVAAFSQKALAGRMVTAIESVLATVPHRPFPAADPTVARVEEPR